MKVAVLHPSELSLRQPYRTIARSTGLACCSPTSIPETEKHKLLGISKLSTDNKMTLIERAAEFLGTKKGDLIAFYEDGGKICIERA